VSADEFWRRKVKELNFLESYTGSGYQHVPLSDLVSLRQQVSSLRKRLLIRQAEESAELSETSTVGPHRYLFFGKPVKYGYQRYDLERVEIDWEGELYYIHSVGRFTDGLLLSSGMSAVAALFSTFARRGWTRVQFSPVPYYESQLLATRFFKSIRCNHALDGKFSADPDVLWLDTSSLIWPEFPKQIGSIRLLVVDTTCVEPDSSHIQRWINESERLNCPVILVRSHIKLDSFGMELGRLGSIVISASTDQSGDAVALMSELEQARSGFGLGFTLIGLYPWLGDPEFAQLTKQRTAAIRDVTNILGVALRNARKPSDQFEILPSITHGLFLIIRTKLDVTSDEDAPREVNPFAGFILSRKIAESCKRSNLPVLAAASLGLDQLTINDFVNIANGQHEVRIASADIPHELLPVIAAHTRDAIGAFTQEYNDNRRRL
jgi:hypothetical protein